MELKVWVEGLQRIVCGVNDATTCQDVVFALAHATGQTGRFTLVERWRNNERALAPHDRPLKVLSKWGEYAADVHLVLRRSQGPLSPIPPSPPNKTPKEAVVKKALTFSGGNNDAEKKIPDASVEPRRVRQMSPSYQVRPSPPKSSPKSPQTRVLMSTMSPPPYRSPPSIQRSGDKVRMAQVPANGHPRSVPPPQSEGGNGRSDGHVQVVYDVRYRDLVRLVNMQRETLSKQHAQLTQYDAEIGYWEEKHNEVSRRAEIVDAEMRRLEKSNHELRSEEVHLEQQRLDEELEKGKQQERRLAVELGLFKTKLANCEAELSECKNKIRSLMEEMAEENRLVSHAEVERERNLLNEIEDLRREISDKMREYESRVVPLDTLAAEVAQVEANMARKKNEVETLVREIKEANLKSLSIAPAAEEVKHSEGVTQNRAGSTRKIVGSPRQLENAVPTNKNPNGVWV